MHLVSLPTFLSQAVLKVNTGLLEQIDYCSMLVGAGSSALQRFQGASLGLEEIRVTPPGQPTMDLRYMCQIKLLSLRCWTSTMINFRTLSKNKGPANKNKDAANKDRDAANMDEEVIAHVAKMLNEHRDELRDALLERHDQIINRLKYDPISISNRGNANKLVCREVQTESKFPFDNLETIGSNLTRDVGTKDVKATTKPKLVITSFKGEEIC